MTAAALITGGAILLIYVIQVALGGLLGGLGAAAVGYLAVIAAMIVVARITGCSLGIERAHARFWIAAVMIGMTAWYVDLRIVEALHPPDMKAGENLEHLVEVTPLGLSLFGLALLPALGEELVFRGVLARTLARHNAWLAIIVSAIVFAAYHLVPVQIVGTFGLALALGVLAVRSKSVVPGMVAHFLNNATVLVIARVPVPGLPNLMRDHSTALLIGTAAIMLGGVALAAKAAA
jgi:membrane protease YdiL (CAAX protease family)